MREGLDIHRFWWRGAEPRPQARASRPTEAGRNGFTDASELIVEPHEMPVGSRRSSGGGSAAIIGVVLIAVAVFTIVGRNSPALQLSGSISEQVDQFMIAAGLGVDEIQVTGHRYTLDSDIFAALDLDGATSLLRYNSEAARRRVEALSWIDRASVTRVLPDTVEVRVSERKPVAVWLHGRSATLVDAEGRHLAHVTPSTLPLLPRISGAGAPEAVGVLVAALAAFPVVAKRVTVSVRVGQRRWSLDLDNGSRIHLPADGETAALDRLMRLGDAAGLLTEPGRIVDLRIEDRIAVAPRGAAPAASAAPERTRTRKSASAL